MTPTLTRFPWWALGAGLLFMVGLDRLAGKVVGRWRS